MSNLSIKVTCLQRPIVDYYSWLLVLVGSRNEFIYADWYGSHSISN